MAKILTISHCFPEPDTTSADRRYGAMLEMLSNGHLVDLYCTGDKESGVERRYIEWCARLGVGVFFGTPDTIDRLLLRRVYDAVLIEWWSTASLNMWPIRHSQPWAKIIVDAVDVQFVKEEAALALGLRDPETVFKNRRREIATYRATDAVIAITDEDQAVLKASGVATPTFLIPNIVAARPRSSRSRERELVFVGSSEHPANVDGQLWFANEIWPKVRAEVPDARLTLIGSHPAPEVRALARHPGIEVLGFVPDTAPYLDRAAVSIAPLRWGGGMKGKVCEAMACGIPVVATSFGAQGLNANPGEHMFLADDPTSFARRVAELLRDELLASRIGLQGQELIRALCSPEVVGRQLVELIGWVTANPRPRRPLATWCTKSLKYHTKMIARSFGGRRRSA